MTRPYEFVEFTDTYGNKVMVQESSTIEDGDPHCWVRIEGKKSSASAHLTVEMAKELILGLAEFVGRSSRS